MKQCPKCTNSVFSGDAKCFVCGHSFSDSGSACPGTGPVVIARLSIEQMVAQDMAARAALGLKKYGFTVAENPLPLKEWLQHAYQESLDLPIYLKRALVEIEEKEEAKKRNEEERGWRINEEGRKA